MKIINNGSLNACPAWVKLLSHAAKGLQEGMGDGGSLLSVISVERLRLKREPFLTGFSPEAYKWFRNLYHLGIHKRSLTTFTLRLILRPYHFNSINDK